MQIVTTIVDRHLIDRLTRGLRQAKISGYTVTAIDSSDTNPMDLNEDTGEKAKLEILIQPEYLELVLSTIQDLVGSHEESQGLIYLCPVTRLIKIEAGKITDSGSSN